jgi:hypothetical protein
LDTERASFGFGERGQQHGRQNRDDCDNYEQFDKGERPDFTEFLHMFLIGFDSADSLRTLKNSFFLSTLSLENF